MKKFKYLLIVLLGIILLPISVNAEDKAKEAILGLISEKGVIPFVINLFVIAIIAGITEEFLFRGALFSIIRRKIKNPHVIIWIIAAIFSAIHLQFYGFVPRMLLGALMGYLLYWTGSIWVPVFAHFLNNAIGVVSMYFISDEEFLELYNSSSPVIAPEEMLTTLLSAALGLVMFVFCVITMRRICMPIAPGNGNSDYSDSSDLPDNT